MSLTACDRCAAPSDRRLLGENSMPKSQGLLGRRTFLLLAMAAATWGGPVRAALGPGPAPDAGLALAFKHRGHAIAIGRRYLGRYPDDPWPGVLARGLGRASPADPAAARLALSARVREDFERGDTVLLDGWVLARSEGRACAALALAADAAG
jgi:hypothetical protein